MTTNADVKEIAITFDGADVLVLEVEGDKVPRSRLLFWLKKAASGCGKLAVFLMGISTLIAFLSLLAAIPVAQFLALGYMLEAAGRAVRNKSFRNALPGLDRMASMGPLLLATWLFLMPLRYVADVQADAVLIDPGASTTLFVKRMMLLVTIATVFHVTLALFRGRFWYFFRPFNNIRWLWREWKAGGLLRRRWQQAWSAVKSLRLWYFFSLGFRGFCGAAFWLFIPATLLAVGKNNPLVGLIGGLSMAVIVCWLPFLQLRFATENRFSAMFEVGTIRALFRKSPIAYLVVLLLTLALSIPLYLFKVEEIPRDAVWAFAVLFVVTILPLKLIAAWAYGRSLRKEANSWRLVSWPCRFVMLPIAVIYSYVVFLTQYTGWNGALSLYEHHAFLLPVPF